MSSAGDTRPGRLARKGAATAAVLAAVAGLELFAATGSFDDRHLPVTTSVVAPGAQGNR